MKRIVVLGGTGFFGRVVAEELTKAGLQPVIAARSAGDIRIDANDAESVRANLKQRDLVIDAAGPFQQRNSVVIDAARTIGFDVIDLCDSPEYAAMVYKNTTPIEAAGIRVLTACSSLSTVSAIVLASSGLENPKRISVYLRPASRYTANAGATLSFLAGVRGRGRIIDFPRIGARTGLLVNTVDSVTLPPLFPSLQTIELIADSGNFLANALMPSASVRGFMERHIGLTTSIARKVGNKSGTLGYEIAGQNGRKYVVFTGANTHLVAVIPAVEAARAIVAGSFARRGVVTPNGHVDAATFWRAVESNGIRVVR